jgi:hydrogenase maturation protein HypF
MAERGVDEMVAVICDGYGYGSDGKAWGGEVLLCRNDGSFQRLGHLEEQPLVGGDLATRYPMRMTAGMLSKTKELDVNEWLLSNAASLPHGKEEAKVIMQQLNKPLMLVTSSCGRVLDAVSALLGICNGRTYEGEPAMKLEAQATDGKEALKLEPLIENNVLNTTVLLKEIFNHKETHSRADLAFSAQSYLAHGLAQIALKEAGRLGISAVGFTGGVAHNEQITRTIRKIIEESKLKFMVHESVPPSDGGISLGQAVAASWQMR